MQESPLTIKKGDLTLLEYLKRVSSKGSEDPYELHAALMTTVYGEEQSCGLDWIEIKEFVDELIEAIDAGVFKDTNP